MASQYDRCNRETEAAVNRGLAAAKLLGLQAGAKVMHAEDVPLRVAARVLLYPQFRRQSDWSS